MKWPLTRWEQQDSNLRLTQMTGPSEALRAGPVDDGGRCLASAAGLWFAPQAALDHMDADPDARPAHVLRFGAQLDMQGVIPEQADRAVRYLTKYLTKAIGETYTDPEDRDDAYEAHIDGCTANCASCPAHRAVRTGCATASNPPIPDRAWCPVAVAAKPMNGRTSVSAADGCSTPSSGPVRPWPNTKPTGPQSSGKPCCRPASTHPNWTGWPPA